VHQLLLAAFDLYRRYPLLFFLLAAGVIVPYELVVLATTGTGAFSRGDVAVGTSLLLALLQWVLVGPLISALHVHAVAEAGRGRDPRIRPVAIQGLKVLPVVASATVISGLGTFLGFLALIVPGIILFLRWVVVAQTAAIDHEGWLQALRRSRELSANHYWHISRLIVCLVVVFTAPFLLGGAVFGHHDTSAASFLAGTTLHTFTASFGALAIALLFFDLLARRQAPAAQPVVGMKAAAQG
jgi:hypothetical protein